MLLGCDHAEMPQERPLDDGLLALLRQARRRQTEARLLSGAAWTETGYVLTDAGGHMVRPEFYSDTFARLAKAAGLPPIRLHDLRHASVTTMLDSGVPVHIVAAWHGHDPAMTLKVYGHVHRTALADAGTTLGAAFEQR